LKKIKQSHILGAKWGNIQLTSQHSNTFIQAFILAFSGTAAYRVINDLLLDYGIYIPFWGFVLTVVVSISLLLIAVWFVGMPSIFISWNRQWWEHQNPLRKEITEINKKLDRLLNEK